MEKKLKLLLRVAKRILGDNTSIMIIASKDGECGGSIREKDDNIAQAIFSLLNKADTDVAKVLYKIIKLNVLNMFANPSPYAIDLSKAISNVNSIKDE